MQNKKDIRGEYLSVSELSEYLKIPIKTIYQFTHKKVIPFSKIGKRLIFSKEDIDHYVKTKKLNNERF